MGDEHKRCWENSCPAVYEERKDYIKFLEENNYFDMYCICSKCYEKNINQYYHLKLKKNKNIKN